MRRTAGPLLMSMVCLSLVGACSSGALESGSSASSAGAEASASTGSGGSSLSKLEDVVANPPSKKWQDAVSAAGDDFKGDVTKIELEPREKDGTEYKVELLSQDTKYAAQYDGDTLTKVSEKRETLGDDAARKRRRTFDPSSVMDLSKAADTARGQRDGIITKWKIEGKDSGRPQYEFDIRPEGSTQDAEVQIDAQDGSIVQDD